MYCTQTLRHVICTRVLRLILAASVYADLTILCGVIKGMSERDKLLKIWNQKLTAFYFQIYVKSKKKVIKKLLLFFCQILVKSQLFPPKKCLPKKFVVFCLNLVENKNISKVLTKRLRLFSRNLLVDCIFPLLLQPHESDYIHLVICSSELSPISVATLFEKVRLIVLSQSFSLICPFYGKKVPQINFCLAKHCLLSFIMITV